MAANVRTEMRIPTRSAPRPPVVSSSMQRDTIWASSNDIFGTTLTTQPVQRKKPPPRPPPPKFNQNRAQNQRDLKYKKPTRPTELLTNLFSRKTTKNEQLSISRSNTNLSNVTYQSGITNGTVSLIDLSPPGSPTFTTRSSSDGVSIDSFGSDGNSNPSAFTSSGNTSQTESAFEDDFDFFGSFNKTVVQNDPWQAKPVQDPFGPIEINNSRTSENVTQIGSACFFAFNNDNNTNKGMPSSQIGVKTMQSIPTIIRPRPPKPPVPKILQTKAERRTSQAQNTSDRLPKTIPIDEPVTLDLLNSWNDDNAKDNPSPPMPTIPPPAPPLEYFDDDVEAKCKAPYGIALFDFPVTHADDLPLKEGDIVTLIKVINDDWMEGRIGNRQGIFPINFIDIKIPLPGLADDVVTALYPFQGETTGDLSFQEGAKIKVLSRISNDWLYGECEGKRGQFPTNYVNRIPCNI